MAKGFLDKMQEIETQKEALREEANERRSELMAELAQIESFLGIVTKTRKAGATGSRGPRGQKTVAILSRLAAGESYGAIKADTEGLDNTLQACKKTGLVENLGRGNWVITAAGRQAVTSLTAPVAPVEPEAPKAPKGTREGSQQQKSRVSAFLNQAPVPLKRTGVFYFDTSSIFVTLNLIPSIV